MLSSTESEELIQDSCELEIQTESDSSSVIDAEEEGQNVGGGSKPLRSLRMRSNRRPHIQDRVRHKRQTLQDMAKPLKAWLYEHKDNPYPTKTEKILLALGSHMTLVQVSNWFANARRRLKNTVRHPGLTWSKRIKMYNHFVKGNAELLSISSGSSETSRSDINTEDFEDDASNHEGSVIKGEDRAPSNNRPPSPSLSSDSEPSEYPDEETAGNAEGEEEDDAAAPSKYKHTILQRYLNDSYNHHCQSPKQATKDRVVSRKKKSGSLSSHDYEDMSASPNDTSSNEGEHHRVFDDFTGEFTFPDVNIHWNSKRTDETYWKEINAAMALTHMARLKQRQLQARSSPCGATC